MNPLVVLIHGFGTSKHLWDGTLPYLNGPALPLDLPGFGDSAHDGRIGVDGMADAVWQKLEGLESFVLVGHSMGAKVAAVLAGRRPAGLAGLLLIAPSPPSPEPMTLQQRLNLKAAFGQPDLLKKHYRQITHLPLNEAVMAQLVADGTRASRAAWNAWPDTGSREQRQADAARNQAPVWILTSTDDPIITPEVVAQRLLPVFPDAALTQLRGSGHLLPLEMPREVAETCRFLVDATQQAS